MMTGSTRWPPPLRRVWEDYQATSEPFRKVHRLVDCIEVHLKLMTVIAVQEALEHEGLREKLLASLAGRLSTPSLGTWHHLLQRAAGELKTAAGGRVPELIKYYTRGRTGISQVATERTTYQGTASVSGALSALTALRNHYAHGATPPAETCRVDVDAFHPLLDTLLQRATFLDEYSLRPSESGNGECIVQLPSGELRVWPLLLFDEKAEREEDAYFFFNDSKRNKPLHFLEYVRAAFLELDDRRTERAFVQRFQDEGRGERRGAAARRRDEYLSSFLGRVTELEELRRLTSRIEDPGGLLVVQGGFGMGKGAILSRVFASWGSDLAPERRPLPEDPEAEVTVLSDQLEWPLRPGFHRWVYYLERVGLNRPEHVEAELVEFLSRELGLRTPRDGKTPGDLLATFSATLAAEGERLALFIDGLDEANRPVLEYLPIELRGGALRPYPGVSVIVSCRPVERVLRQLPPIDDETILSYELGPMCARDIRALLYQGMSKYHESLAPVGDPDGIAPYVREVHRRSEGSPRYLECLVDQLRAGLVQPGDLNTLPFDLYHLYDRALDALCERADGHPDSPRDTGGSRTVVEAVLKLLAVAREPLTAPQVARLLSPYLRALLGRDDDVFGPDDARAALEAAKGDLLDRRTIEGIGDVYTFCHQSVRDFLAVREATEGDARVDSLAEIEQSLAAQFGSMLAEPSPPAGRLAPAGRYLVRNGLTHLVRCTDTAESGVGRAGTLAMLEDAYGAEEMCRFRDDRVRPPLWPRKDSGGDLKISELPSAPEEARAALLGLLDGRTLIAHQAAAALPVSDIVEDRLLLLHVCLSDTEHHDAALRALLDTDFEAVEDPDERLVLGQSWVSEAAAALARSPGDDDAIAGLTRALYDAGRRREERGESALGVRIAIRTAAHRRDHELLLKVASAGKNVYFSQLASDELYVAASEDVEARRWDELGRLFSVFTSRIESLWRLVRNRPSLKPIFVTCGRLLINFSTTPRVLDGLARIARTVFRVLPRFDGVLFQRLLIPVTVRLLYPMVREKWRDVAKHGDVPMELEEVCTIRETEIPIMEEVIRILLEEIPSGTFDPELARDATRLLLDLGLVCSRDPLFQIRRSFHGNLLYVLHREHPEWVVASYLEPYILDRAAPLADPGFPERPDLEDPEDLARYAGLNEMVMRFRTYVAIETEHPEQLLDLHERIARHMIEHQSDTFCRDYNVVGRPSHQLPALALLEVRAGGDDAAMPRTRRLVSDLLRGELQVTSETFTSFDAVAKCIYDLLMVGIIAPESTFAALGQVLDLAALDDGERDSEGHEPSLESARALVGLDRIPADDRARTGLRKIAARAAVVLGALETLYASQVQALYEREGLSPQARVRLRNWAAWGDHPDRWPLDRRGKLTRERIVQKYGEQARIGLFVNSALFTYPAAREMTARILRQWMTYCRQRLGDRRAIPERDVRHLLRAVIKEVFSFVRQRLDDATTAEPSGAKDDSRPW